jgi:hypothetical protein
MSTPFFKGLVLVSLTAIAACGAPIVVYDPDGALGSTQAPVVATVQLSKSDRRAALEGRLQIREISSFASARKPSVPVQLLFATQAGAPSRLCWLMPPGSKSQRRFRLHRIRHAPISGVVARQDAASGQFDITDAGHPVLRYNYATVEPGDFITNVAPANRIYARPRSDYIHPLFGLDGETLTKDWSKDHPHHRGIYWAWPEVDWRGQRGDLHALQHVFARPTGRCVGTSGPVFAQLEAENVWKWEDGESLVHERAIIRAYHANGGDRLVDLEFQFTALNDTVSLARRGTLHYGGLNIRLAKVLDQETAFHTDATNAAPRMAWAELSGKFGDAAQACGIVVLQHSANPCYPGDWVKFPELNWFQPTFPARGLRYALKKGEPLVLRFRLWLHRGAQAGEERCVARWRAYQSPLTPCLLSAH